MVNAPFSTVAGMPREALGHACGGPAAPQSGRRIVEGFLAPHHEVQVGFGDMVEAAMEHDGQHDVVERGVVGGAMAGADAAGVLAETHVAPIVVAVLDLPVAAVPGEQPFGVRPVLWNGGMPKAVSSLVSPVFRSVRSRVTRNTC